MSLASRVLAVKLKPLMQKDIICAFGCIASLSQVQAVDLQAQKNRTRSGFVCAQAACWSGRAKQLRHLAGLRALQIAEGFAHHLLGQARTLAALAADAEALAHVAIAAATVINRIADLTVGDTLAEADIHGLGFAAGCG